MHGRGFAMAVTHTQKSSARIRQSIVPLAPTGGTVTDVKSTTLQPLQQQFVRKRKGMVGVVESTTAVVVQCAV